MFSLEPCVWFGTDDYCVLSHSISSVPMIRYPTYLGTSQVKFLFLCPFFNLWYFLKIFLQAFFSTLWFLCPYNLSTTIDLILYGYSLVIPKSKSPSLTALMIMILTYSSSFKYLHLNLQKAQNSNFSPSPEKYKKVEIMASFVLWQQ